MASRLLNVLQNIEHGRQKCIQVLKEIGIELPEDSTLDTIAEDIEEYIDPITGEPIILAIPGYEITEETDPDVTKPGQFNTYAKDTLLNTTELTIDGLTYIPHSILFFEADRVKDILSVDYTLAPDAEVIDLINIANSSFLSTQSLHVCYITSDGSQYVFDKDNRTNIEHTWDTTKDIIINGTHYRYVLAYYYRTAFAGSYLMHDTYINRPAEQFIILSCRRGGGIHPLRLEYMHIIEPWLAAQEDFVHGSSPYSIYKYTGFTTNHGIFYVRCINLTDPIVTSFYPGSLSDSKKLCSLYTPYAAQHTIPQNVVCLHCKTLSGDSSLMTGATFDPRSALRYITVNPEEQQTVSMRFYPNWGPNIISENVTKNIHKLTGTVNDNAGYAVVTRTPFNKKIIDFAHLESVTNANKYTFNNLQNTILNLPELTGTLPGTINSKLKAIIAPKVTSFASYSTVNATVEYLELPSVTEIDTNSSIVNVNNYVDHGNMTQLRYLDLSSLTTLTNSIAFRYLSALQTIVLPDGFKYDVNIYESVGIKKECVLDLFNKCATLAEGEVHTITLPSAYKTNILTDEEIAIATKKGWTIQ